MQNCQLIRGLFQSLEIEKCLWECVWLDWQRMAHASVYHLNPPKKLPRGLTTAAKRLAVAFKTEFNQAWLTRCLEGELVSEGTIKLGPGERLALLSLSKFRGGRTKIGPFEGYLNPGEVLSLEGNQEGNILHKVEKVASGERIILHLLYRKDNVD